MKPSAATSPGNRATPETARISEASDRLREFLDAWAAAQPDADTAAALNADLAAWSERLRPFATEEAHQLFAPLPDPGRAPPMVPRLVVEANDATQTRGSVTFGRYFLGGNGAVHGGAISLLFDDIMGRLAHAGGRKSARTAYLHVDYRSIARIEKHLTVRAWVESEEGRKRMMRAELHDDETLCAEARALFVVLNPGQP